MSDKEQKSLEDRVAELEAKVKELEARLDSKPSAEQVRKIAGHTPAVANRRRP